MFNKIKKLYDKNEHNSKIHVVTGLRRSGTSLMMYALKEAGLKIAGDKWAKNGERIKDTNPNGFWEVGKVTTEEGITRKTGLVTRMGDVVKVMFECLPKSYPVMVDKTIVMVREPRNVIYSFLKHNSIAHVDLFILNWALDVVDSIEFLEEYRKEYIIVFYEDLLDNPEQEMKRVCKFVGGDYRKGAKVVDTKLNRSKGCHYPQIEVLDSVYKYLKCGKVKEILEMRKKIDKKSYKLLNKL